MDEYTESQNNQYTEVESKAKLHGNAVEMEQILLPV